MNAPDPNLSSGTSSASFDGIAPEYDQRFTHTLLGRILRQRVWQQLQNRVKTGHRVLELGCGTGEDALWLASRGAHVLATDASEGMLATARRKAEARKYNERVCFRRVDAGQLSSGDPRLGTDLFDGVLSNFGALNCIRSRRGLAEAVAHRVRAGAWFAAVLMSPLCPWEWVWFLAHGSPRAAFRRWVPGSDARVGAARTRVWYPSPAQLQEDFSPWFRPVYTISIGLVLPTSEFQPWTDRHPRITRALARVESLVTRLIPTRGVGDHYLCLFERAHGPIRA